MQVPPGPPFLYVTSATSSSILMHWKDSSNGNAPITEYTLHYRKTHGNLEEKQLSRHATSHELKSLLCGSTYQIYLTSTNKIGTSPASTNLHVRTQGQQPGNRCVFLDELDRISLSFLTGIPAASVLLAPNSTSIVLRLHSWPDNGCPILYYVLQYRSISEGRDDEWILVSNALKPQRRYGRVVSLFEKLHYTFSVKVYDFWSYTIDIVPIENGSAQRGGNFKC